MDKKNTKIKKNRKINQMKNENLRSQCELTHDASKALINGRRSSIKVTNIYSPDKAGLYIWSLIILMSVSMIDIFLIFFFIINFF